MLLTFYKTVRHESAGLSEVNPATGKTITGGEFAPAADPVMLRVSQMLPFSEPKRVQTSMGERQVQSAPATSGFWDLWRDHKDKLKAAGISCGKNPRTGAWEVTRWTQIPKEEIKEKEKARASSSATSTRAKITAPEGLEFYPYQQAGIKYGIDHPNVLIADEMGLGKTIQAVGIVNQDKTLKKILVICPASLKINWQREFEKWNTRKLTVGIAGDALPKTDVVIVNYDVLKKHKDAIDSVKWDAAICDEAHLMKNSKAQRTQFVLGDGKSIQPIQARRKIFLTGTPIVNRPNELWTLAHALDPQGLGANFMQYHRRYTNAQQTRYGWDFSGASNLSELQDRLRERFMVRRLKANVLTELPPKQRHVIELPVEDSTLKRAIDKQNAAYNEEAEDRKALARLAASYKKAGNKEAYADAVAGLADSESTSFTEMSKLRHQIALAKVPAVLSHVNELLESEPKVILFAHHLDVIDKYMDGLGSHAVKLTGDMSAKARQESVDRFQNDPNVHVFVGNMKAAGVGITLTAARTVVFGELDWSPSNIQQAEDRAHRIGQKDSVLIQHLVYDGSLDSHMAKMLVKKQNVIDKALDSEHKRLEAQADTIDEIELGPPPPRKFTKEQEALIQRSLKHVASLDPDHAATINGIGFNKMDNRSGHRLAASPVYSAAEARYAAHLANKYRRQTAHLVDWHDGIPYEKGKAPTVAVNKPKPTARKTSAIRLGKRLVYFTRHRQ